MRPAFFDRPVLEVAPDLLGALVEHRTAAGVVAVRLTEVEAYDGENDPGSHAFRGRTPRNAVMFGPPGRVYVYFTYGMHWCMNLVCGPAGTASAVLLRAGEVVSGEDLARSRRTASRTPRDLARGPARLTVALGVEGSLDGADATAAALAARGPRPASGPTRHWCAAVPAWGWRVTAPVTRGGSGSTASAPCRPTARRSRVAAAPGHRAGWAPDAPYAPKGPLPVTSASELLDDLQWRGLVAQSTDLDALREALDAGPVTFYCGFDPTAPSLHVGQPRADPHAAPPAAGRAPAARARRRRDRPDRRPQRQTRRAHAQRAPTSVADWVERIRDQIEPFLSFDGPNAAAVMVNNLDWTAPLSAIDFLRDVGKHFRVNRMLAKEAVSARLTGERASATPSSATRSCRAWTSSSCYRRHGCTLQTGGSDQWGNITAGVDLIHRVDRDGPSHALTTPLVTKADGTKFGKTESGTVWLDPAMTSPYAFYQFWLNADDRDVGSYLRVFSFRAPGGDRGAGEGRGGAAGGPGGAARAGRRADRPGARARRSATPSRRPARRCSAAATWPGSTRAPWPPRWPSCRGRRCGARTTAASRRSSTCSPPAGSPRRSRRRAGAVAEGGAYVNNVRVADAEARPADDDLLHGRWLVLRRGQAQPGRGGARRPGLTGRREGGHRPPDSCPPAR